MTDAVLVTLLLLFIWAAVLVPPAAGARAAREAEFLGSIRPGDNPLVGTLGRGHTDFDAGDQPRFRPALTSNARRRQVLGGLVVAMGATLLLGLMPPFHLLLVVHLFLVNSCLAYVGLLVHMRDTQAARSRVGSATPSSAGGYEYDLGSFPEEVQEPSFADAYAEVEAEAGDRYAGYEYEGYAYEGYEGEADDEAEAAYVDELGLALPA